MNKQIISLAMIAMLTSCNSGTSTKQQFTTSSEAKNDVPAKEKKIIRKQLLSTSTFTNIINVGSIDIIFTLGETSLEAEGDSALLEHIEVEFDSNLLTVGLTGDSNTDINRYGKTNNIKLYVSCPSLQCVSICGNGGFTQKGKWASTEEIQVGVLGTGAITLGEVESPSFRIEATAEGPVSITHLKTDKAIINCRAATSVTADLEANELFVYNASSPHLTLTGHATQTYFEAPKDKNLNNFLK